MGIAIKAVIIKILGKAIFATRLPEYPEKTLFPRAIKELTKAYCIADNSISTRLARLARLARLDRNVTKRD